jgi:hypothetical protein
MLEDFFDTLARGTRSLTLRNKVNYSNLVSTKNRDKRKSNKVSASLLAEAWGNVGWAFDQVGLAMQGAINNVGRAAR